MTAQANEYNETQDFDADVLKIENCIKRALELARGPVMENHIEETCNNFEVDASNEHYELLKALEKAQRNLSKFYSKMQTAG